MEELEKILRVHAEKYPYMQPTDGVKLIYQNEFGGGHLIKDAAACLAYLYLEYASIERNSESSPYEPIGNGIIRVHLAVLPADQLDRLGQAFIRSASSHKGSLDSFLQKLDVLVKLTGQGIFSFSPEQLETYLAGYREAGYPAVSHSPEYRQHYKPAYRVVHTSVWIA